ncbi:hypothetical protein [Burkholderia pseudomallei]|uniref:Uncharacterized protein n=1 Tax=Burkholderia pseudomallei TaxID=28450 RepID=A0AA40MEZ1_BURPE|nr:hypothetical protein [Burkholderia pseudomallei]KGS89676.1 hypothetical protein X942_6503 [Burkholderia pseudomallei MSHR5596]KGX17069.1 hypothetical protein Y036_6172 [Burkholderia pseudomallei]
MVGNHREVIARASEDLFRRVGDALREPDEAKVFEQFDTAESTVDQYLDAVAQGSTALPDAQDLSFACALLLVAARTIEKRDIEFLQRLNAPEVGVSLYDIAPEIADMKTRAVAGLKRLALGEGDLMSQRGQSPNGDVPF